MNQLCFAFQLKAMDDEERQQEKKEEEEEEETEGEEEKGFEHKATLLWSKLSEMAVENEEKVALDSQETLEDSIIVEASSSTKSDLNLSNVPVKCSEDKCTSVLCPKNITKDINKRVTNLYPNHSELLADTENEYNVQAIAGKELPLHSKTDINSSHGIVNELSSSEKKVKELKNTDDTFTSDTENIVEAVKHANSDGESLDEFSAKLLTRDDLLALFKMLHMKKGQNTADDSQTVLTTVGLVSKHDIVD